jgi:hypothetical protein
MMMIFYLFLQKQQIDWDVRRKRGPRDDSPAAEFAKVCHSFVTPVVVKSERRRLFQASLRGHPIDSMLAHGSMNILASNEGRNTGDGVVPTVSLWCGCGCFR